VKTTRTFLRGVTQASPLALALLGGGTLAVAHEGGYLVLDGWLRLKSPPQARPPDPLITLSSWHFDYAFFVAS
jgi:hypothetical protein